MGRLRAEKKKKETAEDTVAYIIHMKYLKFTN